jgi:hypothetical protein
LGYLNKFTKKKIQKRKKINNPKREPSHGADASNHTLSSILKDFSHIQHKQNSSKWVSFLSSVLLLPPLFLAFFFLLGKLLDIDFFYYFCFFFFLYIYLSGYHGACIETTVLGFGGGRRLPLLLFSQGLHRRREIPVLLIGFICFYLHLPALFTTERSVPSANPNKSPINHPS